MAVSVSSSLAPEKQGRYQDENPPNPPQNKEGFGDRRTDKNIIFILISAPLLREDKQTPVEALSIQKEIDDLIRNLEDIPEPIEIEVIVDIATTETVHRVFTRKVKPLIIHFIGHGMNTEDGIALLLEDRLGIARPFSESKLRILLDGRSEPPCQIALLNACYSEGLANALLNGGVPHVIAVNAKDRILDIAARCFSQHFYQALFNRDSILDAFFDSRKAVLIDDDLKQLFNPKTYRQDVNLEEYLKFHLLPASSSIHNQPLQLQSFHEGQIKAPLLEENTNLDWGEDEETFVGRRIELHQIASDLDRESRHRCVHLHGMGGMGKTALAKAAGRWQKERHRWKDGVWFIKLRDLQSVAAARAKIVEALPLSNDDYDRGKASNSKLANILKQWNVLIILDDLDRLIEENEDELVDLLKALLACRKLKLLVTSREDFSFKVSHQSREVQGMSQAEAIQTFRKYAPPEEQWTWGNTDSQQDFEEVIRFLDGYPLPMRLAASYLQAQRCGLSQLKNEIWRALEAVDSRKKPDRDTSLTITLNLSYKVLPTQARDIFPMLALFPGGMSEELATFIMGETSVYALRTLLQFSMAEQPENLSTWRVTLPEPARRYAETKLIEGTRENYYLRALEYFYEFSQRINQKLLEEGESQPNRQSLLEEQS